MNTIVFKNYSTAVSDTEVRAAMVDLETQANRDFCPSWGAPPVKLEFRADAAAVAPGEWLMTLLDYTNEAGALGYHDVTSHGDPLGIVGVRDTMNSGGLWTVTTSHELLEMIGDPTIDRTVDSLKLRRRYIAEACDSVEADELGYVVGSTPVSDFVLPGFWDDRGAGFDGTAKPATLSFCGHVRSPHEIASGGYLSWLNLDAHGNPVGDWQQAFGMARQKRGTGRPGTRRGTLKRQLLSGAVKRRSTR